METSPDSRRMPLRIQVLACDPLAARYVVNMLSAHRKLGGLLARPPASDFNLQKGTSPRLFILDTYLLPAELSQVSRHFSECCPGSRFVALLPAQGYEDGDILRMLYLGFDGLVKLSHCLEHALPHALTTDP